MYSSHCQSVYTWEDKKTLKTIQSPQFSHLYHLANWCCTAFACFFGNLCWLHVASSHSFEAHIQSFWLVESGRGNIFTLICLPVHFECTDSFCLPLSVLIVHSFVWFDFLFIRFLWLIAQPTIWWTATVWIPLPKVIPWNPFQYYTVCCPVPTPVPHPVLHFYSNQSWDPNPPFPVCNSPVRVINTPIHELPNKPTLIAYTLSFFWPFNSYHVLPTYLC